MSDILTAIGLMSGTSLDGVDAAVLRTDGERVVEAGPALHFPYTPGVKASIQRAIRAALEGREGATEVGQAAVDVTDAHVAAVEGLIQRENLQRSSIDVIGFHGQTILHRPARSSGVQGRTWQIGDGAQLAAQTKIDVVFDFRSADVAAGGEGAPLAPIYHWALVNASDYTRGLGGPVAVLNLGGVANITYVSIGGQPTDLIAFDCGPGNGLIDEWMQIKTGLHMDEDGALARSGKVHTDILRTMLLNPFLRRTPPKSLDRYDFKLEAVLKLPLSDGAATLTAFTAACVRTSEKFLPAPPALWVVCGGGRRNPAIMEALAKALDAPVVAAEEAGWRGDDIEAECFAYLAVRSLKRLPISFPKTTHAPHAMTGGVLRRWRP